MGWIPQLPYHTYKCGTLLFGSGLEQWRFENCHLADWSVDIRRDMDMYDHHPCYDVHLHFRAYPDDPSAPVMRTVRDAAGLSVQELLAEVGRRLAQREAG